MTCSSLYRLVSAYRMELKQNAEKLHILLFSTVMTPKFLDLDWSSVLIPDNFVIEDACEQSDHQIEVKVHDCQFILYTLGEAGSSENSANGS